MLIQETLEEQGFNEVHLSLSDETITLSGIRDETAASCAAYCTELLREHGYVFYPTRPTHGSTLREWYAVAPLVALIIVGLRSLDQLGVTTLLSGRDASLSTAFLVGLVASVSTCLAVVGGLVLSLSATYARKGATMRPHALFHLGRLGGFFVLGGLLGALGSVVRVGVYGSTILGIVVSVVMLVLGLQLLELTPRVHAFTIPRGLFDRITVWSRSLGRGAPVLIGTSTFFLPCGFTQSMQVMALASGSMVQGALTMVAFALGTLPVLALLSFGSRDLAQSKYRGVFFKVVGCLVILFALFNLHTALTVFGII